MCLYFSCFTIFSFFKLQDDHLDQPPSPDPLREIELPNENPIDEDEDLSPVEKKRKTTEDFLNEPKAPLEDTWQPIEPHEIAVIPKPLRRGRRKTTAAVVDVKKLSTTSTRSRRRGGNRGSLNDCSNNNELSKVSNAVESLMMQDLQKAVPNNIVVESNLGNLFHKIGNDINYFIQYSCIFNYILMFTFQPLLSLMRQYLISNLNLKQIYLP